MNKKYWLFTTLIIFLLITYTSAQEDAPIIVVPDTHQNDEVSGVLERHNFELLGIFTSETKLCLPPGITEYVIQVPFESIEDYIKSNTYTILEADFTSLDIDPST